MGIGKVFAIILFPLSIIILLEKIELFTIDIAFDKVLIGAFLMILLQIITLIMLNVHHGKPTTMNIITACIFIIIAVAAIISAITELLPSIIQTIMAVTMFVEALYALH